jgi:uncharacterized Zn-finger protein
MNDNARMIMPAMVQDDSKHRLIQPNAQHQYTVTTADLPLSCPMPGMFLWNSHPKVYLAIEPTGWAKCPYCGAEYTLKAEAAVKPDAAVKREGAAA